MKRQSTNDLRTVVEGPGLFGGSQGTITMYIKTINVNTI